MAASPPCLWFAGYLAATWRDFAGYLVGPGAGPGQHELDFEAEEAAILAAVGESRIDLVVVDTGDRSSWPAGWQPWAGCRWCTCPATG